MNLKSDKRLNIQLRLDFPSAPTGEARQAGRKDNESLSAGSEPERPANTSRLMGAVCERGNLEGSIAAGERQQRQRGCRPDDGRSTWRLSEATLAGPSGAIAE